MRTVGLGAVAIFTLTTGAFSEMRSIKGKPAIDSPELLEWPYDGGVVTPNLNDPTSNTVHDFHAGFSSCELVLSSEGNYHPALRDIWPIFLAKFGERPLQNWMYTTSPPVALPQIEHSIVQVGNLYLRCRPQVVVASRKVITQLEEQRQTEGQAYALYKDQGSVILVKEGNPKSIRSVWDLGRKDVQYVSPNPALEPGAFGNYLATIRNIAENDVNPPTGMTATTLIDLIFNESSGNPSKWLAGPRIHHRDMPWSIAYGRADAGVILYHLGLYVTQSFSDKFNIVPLGGTVASPQPLKGTIFETRYVVRINGPWAPRQIQARERLVQTLLSDDFTKILEKRGMMRPDGFLGLLSDS